MLKNLKIIKIIFLFTIIILFSTNPVKADLYDDISILTEEDKSYIEEQLNNYQNKHKYNVIVRFLDGSRDIELEMNEWYKTNYEYLEYPDSIIYAINMDQGETLIKAYDSLDYVDFETDEGITDKTAAYLTIADYTGSIDCLLDELPGIISGQKLIILVLIFGINLAIFNIGFFLIARTKGQNDTTTVNTYMNSNSRITGRRDIFLRKTVTKTKKESSSGGSSGGHSSGRGGRGHF